MPPVRLELTTFRLWDWRAADCAKEALGFLLPFKWLKCMVCLLYSLTPATKYGIKRGSLQTQATHTHTHTHTHTGMVYLHISSAVSRSDCILYYAWVQLGSPSDHAAACSPPSSTAAPLIGSQDGQGTKVISVPSIFSQADRASLLADTLRTTKYFLISEVALILGKSNMWLYHKLRINPSCISIASPCLKSCISKCPLRARL